MKQNKIFRLSAILLVLTLLSTCVISGTFAKYTTAKSVEDSARVAKWGVTVSAETFVDDQLEANLSASEEGIVVDATSELLAPGTGIELASIEITGTPDVAVQVTYSATLELVGWKVEGVDYVPIVFVINGNPVTGSTMTELKENVETVINAYTKGYAAGTNLSTKTSDELTVSCYWLFETGADQAAKDANSVKDTKLGNAAAAGSPASFNLTITCTVTQVD